VQRDAAWRRANGVVSQSWHGGVESSPEYFALMEHVEQEMDATSFPERASHPADEPVIERLLAAGDRAERRMALLLLEESPYVLTGALPAGVTMLAERRRDGA
jgi:hypothetical protein